jgi:hypothetical protein
VWPAAAATTLKREERFVYADFVATGHNDRATLRRSCHVKPDRATPNSRTHFLTQPIREAERLLRAVEAEEVLTR